MKASEARDMAQRVANEKLSAEVLKVLGSISVAVKAGLMEFCVTCPSIGAIHRLKELGYSAKVFNERNEQCLDISWADPAGEALTEEAADAAEPAAAEALKPTDYGILRRTAIPGTEEIARRWWAGNGSWTRDWSSCARRMSKEAATEIAERIRTDDVLPLATYEVVELP